jgi:Tol biopolymer transport system component
MKRFIAVLTAFITGTSLLLVAAPAHGTAHGKNGRIAFRRYYNADHTRGDVFTISQRGTREQQVTRSKRTQLATEPDWSPNGRWLLYQVAQGGNLDDSHLYKIRPNGADRKFIDESCQAPCRSDGFGQWSPGGRRIAFQRQFGPADDPSFLIALFTMRADGTHPRRITQRGADPMVQHRFQDLAPTWAPSARRLAFERVDNKTGHHAVFTVRLDGTALERITPWRLDAAQPDWSPNGRWILFRSAETSDTMGNVWLVRPDGHERHSVTHTPAGKGKWGSGSFSPNGRWIVASHSPGAGAAGNADLYVMRLDGSHRRNITGSGAFESAPDWGPRR